MMEGSFIQALSGVMGRAFPSSPFFRGRTTDARMRVAKLGDTLQLTMSCIMAAKSSMGPLCSSTGINSSRVQPSIPGLAPLDIRRRMVVETSAGVIAR
eukprot:gene3798-biopygen2655